MSCGKEVWGSGCESRAGAGVLRQYNVPLKNLSSPPTNCRAKDRARDSPFCRPQRQSSFTDFLKIQLQRKLNNSRCNTGALNLPECGIQAQDGQSGVNILRNCACVDHWVRK